MERTQKKVTTTKTTHKVKVSADDICALVNAPTGAAVTIYVPGGGDWSNTDLDVNNTNRQVEVTWEVTELCGIETDRK